jgi:hypothetical protein
MDNIEELRDIKINILQNKYKAISAYQIPKDVDEWFHCPNCGLKPLVWEFNNGSSTACGCGENEYRHFSIWAESIMSYIKRNNGSALNYQSENLKVNWNHWCQTGQELEPREALLKLGRW